MKRFTIIGAGLAGLFAAAVLRDECSEVLEAQPGLPNNHSALLRFRTSVVGDALNIPFREVDVVKTVATLGNPVADAIAYSIKTNGEARLRSVLSANGNVEKRYIAPSDLISRIADKVQAEIIFDQKITRSDLHQYRTLETPIISTIPMSVLMNLLGYQDSPQFKSTAGYSVTAKLRKTDLCATIYLPSLTVPAYRASITNDTLIIEHSNVDDSAASFLSHLIDDDPRCLSQYTQSVLERFGIPTSFLDGAPQVKVQQYAKIVPIDDNERKRFILWASENYGIYSLGWFATWRPKLLMDDLVNDLRVIQKLANGGTSYDAKILKKTA